jgi:hypothetical protein
MPKPVRTVARGLLRLARRIHDRLSEAGPPMLASLPLFEWQRLQQVGTHLNLSQERGWTAAVPHLRRDYARLARTLVQHIESNLHFLDTHADRPPVARLADIVADLTALEAEFGGLEIDLKAGTFSVTTEPITFDGIELGPFQIALSLDCIGDPSPYEVRALEPNPAAESSDVVHPHVHGDSLCEGDGKAAIRLASEQGRLFDLCVIVRQILQTYHAGSAYVPLSRWNGRECHDCGRHASHDDSTWCNRCETDLCHDCAESCPGCHDRCCSECRAACGGCDSSFCEHCLTVCTDCGNLFCSECLGGDRCDTCHNALEDSDEETLEDPPAGVPDSRNAATAASPAVLAGSLGQVPVPA